MASLAGEKDLIQAFIDGVDFHTATASSMLGVPVDQVTPEQRKIGKCVTGDTIIFSPDKGLVRIDSLSQFREEDQFTSLSGEVTTLDGNKDFINSFYYGGVKKVTHITTKYGYELSGSSDRHMIKVVGKDGLPTFKKMSELKVGDFVFLSTKELESEINEYVKFDYPSDWIWEAPSGLPEDDPRINAVLEFKGNRTLAAEKLGIAERPLAKYVEKYNIPKSIKGRPHKYLPESLTEDIAQLWGMILSDGSFSERGVSYTTSDKENFDFFYQKSKELWGDSVGFLYKEPENKKPYWTISVSSIYLAKLLGMNTLGRKGESLHIPKEIFVSPKSVQRAFIIGWFNGDGHILEKGVNTGSISRQMAKDLQMLLLSFGIVSSLTVETPTTKRGTDYKYYKLSIVGESSRVKFTKKFGDSLIERKRDRLINYSPEISGKSEVLLHGQEYGVRLLMDFLSPYDKKNMYRMINGKSNSCGRKSLELLTSFDSSDEELTAIQHHFTKALVGDYITVPITSIEEKEEEVFDISIANSHEFISNGFASHNTINFGLGYGLSAGSLGKKLGKSTKEAQQLYDDYFASKKKMKELISHTKEEVLKVGHSRTYFGRIRPFEDDIAKAKQSGVSYDLESVQKRAFNTTIQGTSADLSKIALGRVWKAIQPYGDKIRMLAMIHDEIDFEVHESIPKEEAIKVIDGAMSFYNIHPSWAPIVADFEIGDSFGTLTEASELGVDLDGLLKENRENPPPFDYKPYDKWLAKIDHNPRFTKSTPTVKDFSPNPVVAPKKAPPIDNRSKLTVEELKGKTFKQPTIFIKIKEGIPEDIAFEALRKFISNNFGRFLLILQHDSFYYKFPEEYMVSDNISSLSETFDCSVFDVKPKFKLEL